MAEPDDSPEDDNATPKKGLGKKGWILTIVLALALGGGGFFATYSGLVGGTGTGEQVAAGPEEVSEAMPVFLELDPMMISVGDAGSVRQMRFRAYLELGEDGSGVAALQPRILDVFATYLRAVSVDRLQDPTALIDLRAQLLRRVQLLAGPEAVSDLLIIDFVIT